MLETFIEAFNEKFPYIEVEVSYVSQNQYYNQIIYDNAVGTMPDVFWISQDYIDHIVGQENIIYSLNNIDEKDATFSTNVFVDGALKGASLKDARGVAQLYMIPRDYNEVVMYYDVDKFEAAGIEMPSATEPMTRAEFDAIVYDLREYYGLADMPKVVDVNVNWDSFVWPLLKSFGAKIIDEQGNVMLNSQATKDALLYWRELFVDDIVPPSSTTASGNMFYMGKAPIYFHSRAELINILSSDEPGAPTNIGVAPVPQFGDTYAVGGGSSGYAMYKGTKNATEAWAFLKFIASEEAQEAMGTLGSSIPSLKSMVEDPNASWRKFTHERLSNEHFNHDTFLAGREKGAYTTTRDFFDYMPIGVQKEVIDCIARCFQVINDNLFDDNDLTYFNNQIARQQQDIISILYYAQD
ncbi:MAG: extracellular solute-binding protein [Clostridiales bacterium]|nr:extracellular solute-binding protein [Clostridiales bacterium]